MTVLHDPIRARAIQRAGADNDTADLLHAAELVITSALGSWTMLHRKMRINERDAKQMLVELEQRGIVGPEIADHRRVLVEAADLDDTIARLAMVAGESADDPVANDNAAAGDPVGDPVDDDTVGETPPLSMTKTSPTPRAELATRPTGEITEPPAGAVATVDDEEPPQERQLLRGVLRGGKTVVHTLRHDEHWAYAALRRTVRICWTIGKGGVSWCSRLTGHANHGSSRQQLRMAQFAVDPDGVEKWVKILDKLRNNRIARLSKMPQAIGALAIAGLVAIGVLLFLAFFIGVAAWLAWDSTGWRWWWWLVGLAVVVFAGLLVMLAALAILLAIPVTLLLMYREGLKAGLPPAWMLSTDERRAMDAEITPAKVIIALRDSGIVAMKTYLKDAVDGGAGLLSQITIVGRGTQVVVALPSGVNTKDIKDKKERIAENADRYEHELLIAIPAARHVELWFANPGALEEPIMPSPMLRTETFKSNARTGRSPIGETLKGDAVGLSLWQKHLLITGLSNQGKTNCLRAIALWLLFDLRVHFWIADLKGHIDWDMFADLCDPGRFIKGPTDDDACRATLMVEDAVEEMERRLTSDETEFEMLLVIVDEAQKGYTNPLKDADEPPNPFGGQSNNSRYCMAVRKLKNQGRVVNVIIWEGTQDPTNTNLPKITREASHIRISLVVGTPSQSRMALGDAAVDGGAAPHKLRQDIDKGTVVMHGGVELPPGESALTVRFHYIDDTDAWKLARRAAAKRALRNSGAPLVIDAPETPDHLMAAYRAMRSEDIVRTAVVLGRLIEDDPDTYTEWSHMDLSNLLRKYEERGIDIAIRKRLNGQSCLVREDVERALRERPDDLP